MYKKIFSMKKILPLLLLILLGFSTSCKKEEKMLFDVQVGFISTSDYNLIYPYVSFDLTYYELLSIKNRCVNNSIGDIKTEYGLTGAEIREFIHGKMTSREEDLCMKSLKKGNPIILFFNTTVSSSQKLWMYVDKSF